MSDESARPRGPLALIERAGNALPDPATLFMLGALGVMVLSHWAATAGWSVDKTIARDGELLQVAVTAKSLLTADGFYWAAALGGHGTGSGAVG